MIISLRWRKVLRDLWSQKVRTILAASDEHAVMSLEPPVPALTVGDKLRLIPGHCDPTVNLHDWFVCLRNDRVEALWPITARGALL